MKSLERELQEALEQERDLKEKISDLKKKLNRIELQELRESGKPDLVESFRKKATSARASFLSRRFAE